MLGLKLTTTLGIVVSYNNSESKGVKMRARTRAARSKTWSAQTFFCSLHFMRMNAVWQSL